MFVCVSMSTPCAGAHGDHKMAIYPPELELQMVLFPHQMLGMESRSSERVMGALNWEKHLSNPMVFLNQHGDFSSFIFKLLVSSFISRFHLVNLLYMVVILKITALSLDIHLGMIFFTPHWKSRFSMTLSIFWCIFSAKFLICQSFDILGIFFLWLHTGCLILFVNSHVFGSILILPLLRLLNVVSSGQLLAAVEVNFCICMMLMYQQNYSTHCTFLERSLLSRIFVNIASCTNVFFLSYYMLLFYCCD